MKEYCQAPGPVQELEWHYNQTGHHHHHPTNKLFSRESDSTFTNVRLSVRPSGSKTPQKLEIIILQHLTFIIHQFSFILHNLHTSFLHFATFKLYCLFLNITQKMFIWKEIYFLFSWPFTPSWLCNWKTNMYMLILSCTISCLQELQLYWQ